MMQVQPAATEVVDSSPTLSRRVRLGRPFASSFVGVTRCEFAVSRLSTGAKTTIAERWDQTRRIRASCASRLQLTVLQASQKKKDTREIDLCVIWVILVSSFLALFARNIIRTRSGFRDTPAEYRVLIIVIPKRGVMREQSCESDVCPDLFQGGRCRRRGTRKGEIERERESYISLRFKLKNCLIDGSR